MNYQLNLREVTYALSEALDYVGIDDTMHGKRVAFMAAEIGKKLGWSEREISDIIMIGMLHDCGVSSTDVHLHLVNELDWNDSYKHCQRGAALLENVQIFSQYSQTIFYHHTHWDEFPEEIDENTKRNANLIYLVDRVDALRVQLGDATEQERHSIFAMIQKYSGSMFYLS
jgi:response regulator RpfG family c-di-GMP phosphodiesterase